MNRRSLRLALLWVSLVLLSPDVARPEEPPATAAQIHALSAEEADRALPVTLEGVVTFYDRRWNALFIQDRSGGLYVSIASDDPATASLRAGLRVQVEGGDGTRPFSAGDSGSRWRGCHGADHRGGCAAGAARGDGHAIDRARAGLPVGGIGRRGAHDARNYRPRA